MKDSCLMHTPPCSTRLKPGDTSCSSMDLPSPMACCELSPFKSVEPDISDIWRDAMECMERSGSESDDGDWSDDEHGRTGAVIAKMPCGDLHVCRLGKHCDFMIPNEDRVMVCMYTGLEHGPEHTDEHFDLNGGNGKKSGDPDANCGEPMYGKWVRRSDPVQASRLAFQASKTFDDGTVECGMSYVDESNLFQKKPPKRGALCVGEQPEAPTKKYRGGKKNTECNDTRTNLINEAESVICTLVDHKRASSFKRKAPPGKTERKCAQVDSRMCDEVFVFETSLKRYVKNCMSNGEPPCMDAIHNISVLSKSVSAKARLDRQSSTDGDAVRTAKFRGVCSSLIVALWSAACATPYMTNAKRGSDAYRPFICGVMYAFKRGVSLSDGTVVVPQCPQLANALPVLRGTGGNALAKTLHSSSHRGMCTLSRCIASVPAENQGAVFGQVARIATQFSKESFSKWDI